jgi:hypothetical protein
VLVKDGDGMQVLLVDDIAYIEAQADNVAFHAHGREHLKPQRISELETQLDPPALCACTAPSSSTWPRCRGWRRPTATPMSPA